jgi:hypothetical protein
MKVFERLTTDEFRVRKLSSNAWRSMVRNESEAGRG